MSGTAWVFGDDIDTDALAPGLYMKAPIEELARHCLETVDPGFAAQVQPGDIVVGGRNFGLGSSREQAAQALKVLGVAAVVAQSFAGIFFRNALNLGLPALRCARAGEIPAGARLAVDAEAGTITIDGGPVLDCVPLPPHLLAMVRDGGLIPHLERKLGR
ncbi:MAG: 3-isopropylmalate dehydratase [Hyphomicrobiales bacterium]|nr:3-isopropylmalate dehydratase [Hyphomicrobiales bacterium]